MEELKELLEVSLSGRIGGIETFNQFTEKREGLTYKLFSAIKENQVTDDKEAKELLYGKKYKGYKYNMLKERFKEKLYTNVLFVQPRKKDTRSFVQNAYFCYKYFVVARLLLMISAKKAGRILMRKVLSRAEDFQVYEIAGLCALSMRRESLLMGNENEYKRYAGLYHLYNEITKAEADAEEAYDIILVKFAGSYSSKPGLTEQANQALNLIKQLKNKHNTYFLNNYLYKIEVLKAELSGDYNAAINACRIFENYLSKNSKFYSQVRYANVLLTKINCYLNQKEAAAGIKAVEEAGRYYIKGEGNWFVLQELYFLLSVSAVDYTRAAGIFTETVNHKSFKRINQRQKELWNIFGGYVWFILTYQNRLAERNKIFAYNKFRISKLINEVPIYSKDKKGVNISIAILQTLLHMQAYDYGKAIEKIESLRIYAYKYLFKNDSLRDYLFIKMLLTLVRHDFNPVICEKKAAPHLQKLKTIPVTYDAYSRARVEIIEYEELWQIILNMMRI